MAEGARHEPTASEYVNGATIDTQGNAVQAEDNASEAG